YDGKVAAEEVAARVSRIAALVDELMSQRAEDRIGTEVTVLVEQAEDDDFECTGRAEHQAPEVDGECVRERGSGLEAGDLVRCGVTGTEGADLQVSPREVLPRRAAALAGAGASWRRAAGQCGEHARGRFAAAAQHRERAHRGAARARPGFPRRPVRGPRAERGVADRRVRGVRR